jgi:hypothetical protein
VAQFCAFVVRLPSGERYWTVIDERYRPVPEADDFLLHLRLGRDYAESTTQAYARSVALFLQWCARVGPPPIPRRVGYLAPAGEAWMPADCLR